MIFLGGVHGVGKSSMCEEIGTKLGLNFFSASSIIKEEKKEASLDFRTVVSNVEYNQLLLLQGIEKKRIELDKLFILDGHFAIHQKDCGIKLVALDIFLSLGVKYIILIEDDPSSIVKRLIIRDNQSYDASYINILQLFEIENAKNVSKIMKIPIFVIKAFDNKSFADCLKNIMANQ